MINKHWAKKSQILVHPNELKQAEFRDGPVTSMGMAEVVRLPFGAGGVAWETGLDEITDKLLRCSPDILVASCACPLRKGGRLAAKANYLWVVLSTWFELADEAKTAEAPKCAEIVFVPDGVERCVDFQLKSSPVLGTTVELEYLEMALEWFALHVKQQYVIDSKKFAGLKAEFVVRDGAIFDVDQLDTGRFVASTQILKTVNVIAHYAGCRISHFDKVPKPMSGYNMVFNVFAPYLRKMIVEAGLRTGAEAAATRQAGARMDRRRRRDLDREVTPRRD